MKIVKINEEYITLIKKAEDISNGVSAIKKDLASVRLNLDKVYDGRVDFDTRLRNAEKKLANQASKMKTLSDVIESTIGDIMQIDNVQPQINVESGNPTGVIQVPSLQEALKHWSNFKERYSTSRWKEISDSALPIVGGITGWTTIISTAQNTAQKVWDGAFYPILEPVIQWEKEKAYFEDKIERYKKGDKSAAHFNGTGDTSYSCFRFTEGKLEMRGINYNIKANKGDTPLYNNSQYKKWLSTNRGGTFTSISAEYMKYLIAQQNGEPIYNILISNGTDGSVVNKPHTMLIDKAYLDENGELRVVLSDNSDNSLPAIEMPNTVPVEGNGKKVTSYKQFFEPTDMSEVEFEGTYTRGDVWSWSLADKPRDKPRDLPITIVCFGKK